MVLHYTTKLRLTLMVPIMIINKRAQIIYNNHDGNKLTVDVAIILAL